MSEELKDQIEALLDTAEERGRSRAYCLIAASVSKQDKQQRPFDERQYRLDAMRELVEYDGAEWVACCGEVIDKTPNTDDPEINTLVERAFQRLHAASTSELVPVPMRAMAAQTLLYHLHNRDDRRERYTRQARRDEWHDVSHEANRHVQTHRNRLEVLLGEIVEVIKKAWGGVR